jgi:hypothetical protein
VSLLEDVEIKVADLSAVVEVHINEVPLNLLKNVITQFIDDCTAYFQEAWGLQNHEFHFIINGVDDIEL